MKKQRFVHYFAKGANDELISSPLRFTANRRNFLILSIHYFAKGANDELISSPLRFSGECPNKPKVCSIYLPITNGSPLHGEPPELSNTKHSPRSGECPNKPKVCSI